LLTLDAGGIFFFCSEAAIVSGEAAIEIQAREHIALARISIAASPPQSQIPCGKKPSGTLGIALLCNKIRNYQAEKYVFSEKSFYIFSGLTATLYFACRDLSIVLFACCYF